MTQVVGYGRRGMVSDRVMDYSERLSRARHEAVDFDGLTWEQACACYPDGIELDAYPAGYDDFEQIMTARRRAFWLVAMTAALSPAGQAFVERILAPDGFAAAAMAAYYHEVRDCGGGSADPDARERGYAAVYALVVPMWIAAGYHGVPLRDLWALGRAEFAATGWAGMTHPSARHMRGPALRLIADTIAVRLGGGR